MDSYEYGRRESHGAPMPPRYFFPPTPPLAVPPTVDIATLEAAAEALARHGELAHAVAVWAIVLRLRMELRESDPDFQRGGEARERFDAQQ